MPTLLNFIVDNVVRNWLAPMLEDKLVLHEGLGLAVGRCSGLFYADDGVVRLRDPEWIHDTLNVSIGIFYRYRLVVNVAKSKAMTCQPGTLR